MRAFRFLGAVRALKSPMRMHGRELCSNRTPYKCVFCPPVSWAQDSHPGIVVRFPAHPLSPIAYRRLQPLSRKSPQRARSVQLQVLGKLHLGCWGLNDLESQMGGPPLEIVNLPLAVCCLVDLRSLIHKLHPETQHAINQSGELCRHRLDRDRNGPRLATCSCPIPLR